MRASGLQPFLLSTVLLLGQRDVATAAPAPPPLEPAIVAHAGPKPPWPRRRRAEEKVRPSAHGLVDLKRWPAEPASPGSIEEERLAAALKELCGGWMPPRRPRQYARWILTYSREFDVDPFLIGAFIYRQSRCLPGERSNWGAGLAKLDPRMHAGFLRRGQYRYHVLQDGAWRERQLALKRFSLANSHRAEASIYFTAALLRLAYEQCPGIDSAFGSVVHRHPISHLIWGDRVRGAGPEDRVLLARRRLLEYYQGSLPSPRAAFDKLPLRCPLDGVPRVVTSVLGSDRDNGKRRHQGIDFASTDGEPVRAVADGQVVFAGIKPPGSGSRPIDPEVCRQVKRSQLGPGGLFVILQHAGGLRSAYMHLFAYQVRTGQAVKSGQVIGAVGKSGIKDSGPHLHFELRHDGRHIDPMPHLAPYVIPPDETWLGLRIAAEEKRLRRKRRIERWRARQAGQALQR